MTEAREQTVGEVIAELQRKLEMSENDARTSREKWVEADAAAKQWAKDCSQARLQASELEGRLGIAQRARDVECRAKERAIDEARKWKERFEDLERVFKATGQASEILCVYCKQKMAISDAIARWGSLEKALEIHVQGCVNHPAYKARQKADEALREKLEAERTLAEKEKQLGEVRRELQEAQVKLMGVDGKVRFWRCAADNAAKSDAKQRLLKTLDVVVADNNELRRQVRELKQGRSHGGVPSYMPLQTDPAPELRVSILEKLLEDEKGLAEGLRAQVAAQGKLVDTLRAQLGEKSSEAHNLHQTLERVANEVRQLERAVGSVQRITQPYELPF